MIDVAMSDGDLTVSEYGDISLELTDDDDIIQMSNNAINTIKGELIELHPDFGNDAFNQRLKLSNNGYAIVEECATTAIMDADTEERIDEVSDISAYKGNSIGECCINYTLLLADGRTISSSTSINVL